jgi:uncharacterized membrane protein YfcA
MDFLLESLGALDLSIYPYAALVVLVASFVRGFSGFAGPMIMVPALSLVLPPVEVVPIVLLLEMITAAMLVPKIWRIADWGSLRWIMPAAIIGAPFGVLMLTVVPGPYMALAIAMVVIVFAALFWFGFALRAMPGRGVATGAGVISGALNGAVAIPGPPVILFYFASPVRPATSRASIIAHLAAADVIAIAWAALHGLLVQEIFLWVLLLAPPQWLGVMLGNRRFLAVSEEVFKRAVLVLIMFIGLAGLAKSLAQLTGFVPVLAAHG